MAERDAMAEQVATQGSLEDIPYTCQTCGCNHIMTMQQYCDAVRAGAMDGLSPAGKAILQGVEPQAGAQISLHIEDKMADDNIRYERTLAELDVDAGEDNIIGLMEIGVGLEAVGDNIIVLIDSYRSGYECTACKGTGKLREIKRCVCDPDIPDEKLADYQGEGVLRGTRNKFGAVCDNCGGDYVSKRSDKMIECPTCHGKGASLIIPDTAQSLPTTGVILSVGPDGTRSGIVRNKRIVATPHSGVFLPMKSNIPVKVYRQHEPLCVMYNLKQEGGYEKCDPGELATSKFVEYETPLGEKHNA
jgi:hypothetical protein